jgi:hypothetical protein
MDQELPMRLTEEQRNIIREAGLRHFGVIPHLFGSRLNDTVRSKYIEIPCAAGQTNAADPP